jgi:cell division protein FtsQ
MYEALTLPVRKKIVKKSLVYRMLIILILVITLIIVAELVFHFIIYPSFRIQNIDVKSDIPLARETLLALAGIKDNEYYFSINCETIRHRLEAYPLVKEAHVETIFPETLKLVLKGRVPLALSFARTEEKSVPVVFDTQGVVFQMGKSVSHWDLPVISGLIFKPVMGIELPSVLMPFFEELNHLNQTATDLMKMVSEIKVMSVNSTSYELIIYPLNEKIHFNFGSNINSDLLKYAFMVLDVLKQQGLASKVKELDFRTGEVVYKLKEG